MAGGLGGGAAEGGRGGLRWNRKGWHGRPVEADARDRGGLVG